MSNRQPTEAEIDLAKLALDISGGNRTEALGILQRECGWRPNLAVRAFVVLSDLGYFDAMGKANEDA